MNDFMSQEEIDALLKGGDNQESPKLSEMERDTLAEIGNISMGSAATALSTMVNRKVKITVPQVEVSNPRTVKESYPIPCIVVNVEYVKGLEGTNLLVVKERDALVIGNLMMGEDGTDPPSEVDEIYLSAVTEAMNMMMGSASTSMSDLFQKTIDISPPSTEQRDLSSEELDLGDEEKPVVTVAFRIEIEDLVDSTMLQIIDFTFAKNMVAQLMGEEDTQEADDTVSAGSSLSDSLAGESEESGPEMAFEATWEELEEQPAQEEAQGYQPSMPSQEVVENLGNLNVDLIKDIPVQVRAVLGRTRMPIDSILKLGPGHIMELETLEGEPIEVYANDTLIARGEVVVVGEQYGIRITEISNPRDRINSVR